MILVWVVLLAIVFCFLTAAGVVVANAWGEWRSRELNKDRKLQKDAAQIEALEKWHDAFDKAFDPADEESMFAALDFADEAVGTVTYDPPQGIMPKMYDPDDFYWKGVDTDYTHIFNVPYSSDGRTKEVTLAPGDKVAFKCQNCGENLNYSAQKIRDRGYLCARCFSRRGYNPPPQATLVREYSVDIPPVPPLPQEIMLKGWM